MNNIGEVFEVTFKVKAVPDEIKDDCKGCVGERSLEICGRIAADCHGVIWKTIKED